MNRRAYLKTISSISAVGMVSFSGCLQETQIAVDLNNTTPLSAEIVDHWSSGSLREVNVKYVVVGRITNTTNGKATMPSVVAKLFGENNKQTTAEPALYEIGQKKVEGDNPPKKISAGKSVNFRFIIENSGLQKIITNVEG